MAHILLRRLHQWRPPLDTQAPCLLEQTPTSAEQALVSRLASTLTFVVLK
eukprot:m.21301 g.21301  ORF g.21301 m.21301 type:complete len:50 (+) comp3912_c0_seq1:1666-1815(+)